MSKRCRLCPCRADSSALQHEEKIFLIIGECGDGKSTLINGLRDRRISGEAKTGLLANGVTKDVEAYIGQLSRDQLAVYLDTPGFGDGSVNTVTLVSQLEKELKEGVNGIIITAPATACRYKLSMRIARLLIEIGFEDTDKWNRVVLVGTKADLATPEEKALFDITHDTGIAGQFFKGTNGTLTTLTTKSDTSKLRNLLLKVPSKRIHYVAPSIDQLSEALGTELGVAASSVVAELREKRHEAIQVIGQMAAEKSKRTLPCVPRARSSLKQKRRDSYIWNLNGQSMKLKNNEMHMKRKPWKNNLGRCAKNATLSNKRLNKKFAEQKLNLKPKKMNLQFTQNRQKKMKSLGTSISARMLQSTLRSAPTHENESGPTSIAKD